MADRQGALTVLRHLIALAAALLNASAQHDNVLAPGYTHLQHAQPTILGHYFNAHYWATSRNLSRLLQNFQRLNECPLGGAAHSGTGWPIDRDLTARYLGFSRPIPNARDAGMSAMDSGAELAADLGLTLSGASGCASDLYYWSSSEVGPVRLHPSLCGTSSMMPQKRNPIALERVRALAGDAAGWAASQLGLLHLATSTDADQGYVRNRLPAYCVETAGALALLTAAISTLEIDEAKLAASSGRDWSTSSALADDLVITHGLSYRAAHEAVAKLITAHEAAGTGRRLREDLIAEHLEGYPVARLRELMDPRSFVETRTSAGGTAEPRRKELSALAADDLAQHKSQLSALEHALDAAHDVLIADARTLTAE